MDANRARYLRQQAELGGSEIYLAEGREGGDPAPLGSSLLRPGREEGREGGRVEGREDGRAIEGVPAESVEAGNPAAATSRRNDPLPPGASRWRKDLPPIPGPGLTILPPEAGVFGDELAGLASLEAVAELISGCRKCPLCDGRSHTVPGEGHPQARLMCIGEGPGATEDQTGRPFVGAAGQLLDKMLAAIECPRETVFIANIVKCRPPQNRPPLPDEAAACLPYLHRQIALVRPTVLLALGGSAASYLLGTKGTLGSMRGKVHTFAGIPLVVTYHPAALLRNPNWKKPTWDDVRVARQLLDR